MAIRDYNFTNGPETGTLPTVSSPSADTDFVSKGYVDDAIEGHDHSGGAEGLKVGATKLFTFADDAAYVTNKGSGAAAGDAYFNTTLNSARVYNGTSWSSIGSGAGEGGINYVSANQGNNNAENDASGWTTYDDAASTPVDLDGGTVSATWARSTTNPLRGTGSFLFTPGTTGEGVRYVITPDRADIKNGAVQTISIEYEPTTGTLATGDYTLWVYDVANSALIQPAGYTIPGAASGVACKHKATFQLPTNGTTFRVAIHQAVASPPSLKVDSVSVGPEAKVYGAPVTDWVSYTPTFTGLGTVTGIEFYSRRVGDSLEVRGVCVSGTPTATEMRVSLGYAGGNSNVTVASTVATKAVVGFGGSNVSGAIGWNVLATAAQSYLTFASSTTATNSYTNENGNAYLTNGAYFTFRAVVPIAGWSSSVVCSDSADTRVCAMRAYNTSSTSIPNDTFTTVPFTGVQNDTHAILNAATGVVTIPSPGWYDFDARVTWSGNSSNIRAARIVRLSDSKTLAVGGANASATTISNGVTVGGTFYLEAGTTLTLEAYQNSGGALALSNGDGYNYLCVKRLSGPATVAASESVSCRYGSTSTAALSSLRIDFNSLVWDSHGAVTTGAGAWKFTAPVSGEYQVSAKILTAATTTSQALTMYLYKNGGAYANLGRSDKESTASTRMNCQGAISVKLVAGDYIYVVGTMTSGSTLEGSADINWIEVRRVGNY